MPQKLESRTVKSLTEQETLAMAVSSKKVMDIAIQNAIDKARKDIGVEQFTCHVCGKLKNRDEFYPASSLKVATGVSACCRECAGKIAHGCLDGGEPQDATPETIDEALSYIDFPWVVDVYEMAYREAKKTSPESRYTDDVWTLYIEHLLTSSLYSHMRYKDSAPLDARAIINAEHSTGKDIEDEEYQFNRRDAIRMIGYDPFANYPIEEDKPQLYAQLISLIDEETKNDGMKMGAVIQIVKKFNQAEKMNDQIDYFVNDTKNVAKNMVVIDKLSTSSKKLMEVANALAKDNGISVNFNNNKSAGATTLSGKIKKLSEIGLRSAKINTFDIGTCEGMRQVAEISEAARHKRIGYDENIAAEIKDIKVELVERANKETAEAKEMARKLLLENKDMKEFLKSKGLVDQNYRVKDGV